MQGLPNSRECFVCGEENRSGLRAKFYVDEPYVRMHFRADMDHCSYPGTVHGGVVAAALDECMAWAAARAIQRMCLTGELTVRYLSRVPHDVELTVSAEIIRAHRRVVHTAATLHDDNHHTFARAEARFLPMSKEDTLTVDDHLLYREGDERVFDSLREETSR